jgi:hypothetical protein
MQQPVSEFSRRVNISQHDLAAILACVVDDDAAKTQEPLSDR